MQYHLATRTAELTAHLLAFGLLTALVIFLAQAHSKFQRTWSRPPVAVELQRAFEQYVRSEVLDREALARSLDECLHCCQERSCLSTSSRAL